VLTTENEDQAKERAEGKGRDCAQAAVEMANLMNALEPESDDVQVDEIEIEANEGRHAKRKPK
jgi:6,7-dimethyl-8-ribityllumazine synthase